MMKNLPVGCVIMASGISKRFQASSNKLLADFRGEPLIVPTLHLIKTLPFVASVVVTRDEQISSLAKKMDISVILHNLPDRNDTVRLGTNCLLENHPQLSGILYCVGDQPLLQKETVEKMLHDFSAHPENMIRTGTPETPGNPVLFPAGLFSELLCLPAKKGGGFLAKKYPEQVRYIPVQDNFELFDIDTIEDLEIVPFP